MPKKINKTESKKLNKTEVKELGFSEKLIQELLPEPEKIKMYGRPHPMLLWLETDVLSAMETEVFKEYQVKAKNRRLGAKKGIETKYKKTMALVESAKITVEKMSYKRIRRNALDEKEYFKIQRDDFDGFNRNEIPEDVIRRWCDNYIRHNLTSYEQHLYEIENQVGVSDAYDRLQERITEEILKVYPNYIGKQSRELKKDEVYQPIE